MAEYSGQYDQKFIDSAGERNLKLVAPEQPISPEQVTDLHDALVSARDNNPDQLRDFTIYSDLERRRLTVQLGVIGIHTQLHEAAGSYSELMVSVGIQPHHGRHEWAIGH